MTGGTLEFVRSLVHSLEDSDDTSRLQSLVENFRKSSAPRQIVVMKHERLHDALRLRITEELEAMGFHPDEVERAARESQNPFSRFAMLQQLSLINPVVAVADTAVAYAQFVAVQQKLMLYGLDEQEAFDIVCDGESIDLSDELSIYEFLHGFFQSENGPEDADDCLPDDVCESAEVVSSSFDPASLAAMAEESSALSAVFGDDFAVDCEQLWRLNIGKYQLYVYFPHDIEYPHEVPSILVSGLEYASQGKRMNEDLQRVTATEMCEQKVFAAVSWFQEHVIEYEYAPNAIEKLKMPEPHIHPQDSKKQKAPASEPSKRMRAQGAADDAKVAQDLKGVQRARIAKDAKDFVEDESASESTAASKSGERGFPALPPAVELMANFQKTLASKKYQQMASARSRLPAAKMKEAIVKTVNENQVVVISGETGSGKTTQIPQFILDDMLLAGKGDRCRIICTQPRRIAAVSVATRVAEERAGSLGEEVGYSVRLDAKYRPARSQLLFFTTGVLLRRMHSDLDLGGVSHIIVDEIHERSLDSDFLLIILRELLTRRRDLKVILMSATLNAETFAKYFMDAPCLHIPGFTHPVDIAFLEEVVDRTGYEIEDPENSPYVLSNRERRDREVNNGGEALFTNPTMNILDDSVTNVPLICRLIQFIQRQYTDVVGGILVFLPGIAEISNLFDELSVEGTVVMPLHSSLSIQEQSKVFLPVKAGLRKVVLSTNIAETSVTIDDIVFVIDTGRSKETRYNASSKLPSLVECWSSRAGVKQRTGRAGRVRPGFCFRLFSTHTFERAMKEYSLPEILRVPLENLCLQVQTLGFGDPKQFLQKAVDIPRPKAIDSSIDTLCTIGALDDAHHVTSLGFWIARLPVDVRIGKMILYAAMFQCLDPILTIAAGISDKQPFSAPWDAREHLSRVKRSLCQDSDHLLIVHAYSQWRFAQAESKENEFLRRHFLVRKTLIEIEKTKRQFFDLLVDIGFVTGSDFGPILPSMTRFPGGKQIHIELGGGRYNKNSNNLKVLKAVLFAGLYPNVITAGVPVTGGSGQKAHKKAEKLNSQFFKSRLPSENILLHPNSVVAGFKLSPSQRFLVYYEKMLTTQLYVRDVTPMSPFPLLLFAADVQIRAIQQSVHVDEWIRIDMEPKVAECLVSLRPRLNEVLMDKVANPGRDMLEGRSALVIDAIVKLLSEQP
jgi:HrpA-like RNA helicase